MRNAYLVSTKPKALRRYELYESVITVVGRKRACLYHCSAGDKFNDYMVTNTIVSANGHVLWLYPALIKTYCTLNVQNFPFDRQKCEITFISWTHSGDQLDVRYNDSFANTVYYIPTNQEWAVDGITAERHVKYYACCKEPYPDVTFTIHMRRGSLFYVVNLVAPCLLIFIISFLGFFLPVESGEKVNLEVTILLALVVFLLMVGEMMPPTPDSIPILGERWRERERVREREGERNEREIQR